MLILLNIDLFLKRMEDVPNSFVEAFRHVRDKLVDHIYVSRRLLNPLLIEGLLNQRHVDEIEVFLNFIYMIAMFRHFFYRATLC